MNNSTHHRERGLVLMKYIGYIVAFIVAITGAAIIYTFLNTEKSDAIALTVNNQIVKKDYFDNLYKFTPKTDHQQTKEEFTENLITKILLVQEAHKENIHLEDSFRVSIQDFYEQSLIKLLMDKKFSNVNADISEDLIQKYQENIGKVFTIELIPFSLTSEKKTSESISSYFEYLSKELRCIILELEIGQTSSPFQFGEQNFQAKLVKIEEGSQSINARHLERDRISHILKEHKKHKIINNWIQSIRGKAKVNIAIQAN